MTTAAWLRLTEADREALAAGTIGHERLSSCRGSPSVPPGGLDGRDRRLQRQERAAGRRLVPPAAAAPRTGPLAPDHRGCRLPGELRLRSLGAGPMRGDDERPGPHYRPVAGGRVPQSRGPGVNGTVRPAPQASPVRQAEGWG